MTNTIRTLVVLAATACMAGSVGFAQSSGAATYNAKCKMCHGEKGAANSPMAKMLKIHPANSPEMKKLTEAEMIKATTDGKGKMPAFNGKLSAAQIKDVVVYFRSLK